MTLVFQDGRAPDVPGVHALIVGVGHYRHFPGGSGDEYPDHDGMGQLSSPPHSARAVADWAFRTWHDDTDLPLRSMRLLISEPDGPAEFAHLLHPAAPVAEATIDSIAESIEHWHGDGDRNEENLLVFYFCGHGVAAGMDASLLATDAGQSELNLFRHALYFTDFRAGMVHCKAKRQLYLVDACRVGSEELIQNARERGQAVIPGKLDFPDVTPKQPVLWSAMRGAKAFGLANRPSAFAQALPRVFEGGAWRKERGRWVVCAERMVSALSGRIGQIMHRFKFIEDHVIGDGVTQMVLKRPEGTPLTPVEVLCDPTDATASARLSCTSDDGDVLARPTPVPDSWFIDLEQGEYAFQADFPQGVAFGPGEVTEYVYPSPKFSLAISV